MSHTKRWKIETMWLDDPKLPVNALSQLTVQTHLEQHFMGFDVVRKSYLTHALISRARKLPEQCHRTEIPHQRLVIMAAINGDPIGWALLTPDPRPNRERAYGVSTDVNVSLFVATRWRRKGVGTDLVLAARRESNRWVNSTLWAGPGPEPVGLFARLGVEVRRAL